MDAKVRDIYCYMLSKNRTTDPFEESGWRSLLWVRVLNSTMGITVYRRLLEGVQESCQDGCR